MENMQAYKLCRLLPPCVYVTGISGCVKRDLHCIQIKMKHAWPDSNSITINV